MSDSARVVHGSIGPYTFDGKTAQVVVPSVASGPKNVRWNAAMDNSSARNALMSECAGAIVAIERTAGMKTCAAHDGLAHGEVVLLRCRIADYQREAEVEAQWRSARMVWIGKIAGWGLAIIGSGLFAAWVMYQRVAAFMVERGVGP